MHIIVYILVFSAVLLVTAVCFQVFISYGRYRKETLDSQVADAANVDGNPLERFVSAGRLFQIRLMFALIPALIVPTIFGFSGMTNVGVLLLLACVLGFAGWKAPMMYYGGLVEKRRAAVEDKILDLTAGLSNGLRAGMALPQALERVTDQIPGPIHEELRTVLREYRLGKDLVEALLRMYGRVPCEDLRLLASAIKLTLQSGGSLVEVLAEMVVMIRGRRDFQDKLKTLTAQGRFESIVMAATPIFAFAILYFVNPELMLPLVKTTTGWMAISASLFLEVIGFLVIKKIVTIEV